LDKGSVSFPRKPTIKAEWMIATESPPQADLRPSGIVFNEQLWTMIFSEPHRAALSTMLGYHGVIWSLITIPYGCVHAVSEAIILVARCLCKTPRPLN